MNRSRGYADLPEDLPRPEDDGAAAHLPGMALPSLTLEATDGRRIDITRLPRRTVIVEGETLLKRLTLIVKDGTIEHVVYPVFPPNEAAATVLAWLASLTAAPTTSTAGAKAP